MPDHCLFAQKELQLGLAEGVGLEGLQLSLCTPQGSPGWGWGSGRNWLLPSSMGVRNLTLHSRQLRLL